MRLYKLTFLMLFTFISSCNNESIDNNDPQNVTQEPDIKDRTTTPCLFNLSSLSEGDVKVIDCILDLKGQTINLPENVTLEFDGGDIINGTLNFADNGKIDGRLLNLDLKIDGKATIITNDFVFIPSRWNIVEGEVTREIAFRNHKNIQEAINLLKILTPLTLFERTTFNIAKLDAYFESNTNEIGVPVIEVPSNFNLNMSSETILNVFPVNDPKFTSKIIRLIEVSNVSVKGGIIIGDRKERTASNVGNVLFEIKGGQNIVIDGVNMSMGSITGLTINSVGRKGNPIADGTDYFPSKNVLVKNCIFDSNRSNNLSITDGENITIQNCQLYRAGIDIGESKGAAPRIGIVIEPFLGQVVNGVKILNNTLKESSGHSILAAFGNDFLITGNTTQRGVGWNGASNVKIIDNPSLGGVLAGDSNDFNLSQSEGNIVSNNIIKNASTGILASNDDVLIENNQIVDCKVAIQMRKLKDSEIRNNTITSNVEGSFGINAQIQVDNVLVKENTVKLDDGRSFALEGINDDEDSTLIVENNFFECGKEGRITFSKGIKILNNTFGISGFGITSSQRIRVTGNTITNTKDNRNAFFINNSLAIDDIEVTDNIIENKALRVANGIRLYVSGSLNKDVLKNTSTNVLIKNNRFKVAGSNFAVNSVDFNGVKIENNNIEIDTTNCCSLEIYFRGDNSFLTGNTDFSGNQLLKTDIQGSSNIIN